MLAELEVGLPLVSQQMDLLEYIFSACAALTVSMSFYSSCNGKEKKIDL